VRGFLGSRQQAGCANDNTATIMGTKGIGRELGFAGMPFIKAEEDWRYQGPRPNMYEVEHVELFKAIRAGQPINDGLRMSYSTLAGLMGRMAAYTGQEITWEMAMNSQENLAPDIIDWKAPVKATPMAMPGKTKFI